MAERTVRCRPFLKWAGGKTQLLPELLKRVPGAFGTYREPFLGGGALFFAMQPERAILSDINLELVRTYQAVRDNVDDVIGRLTIHAEDHARSDKEHFLRIREMRWESMPSGACAARMIYLNKMCFNGLYRVNSRGQFNVPFGKFKTLPTICDSENLRACSWALRNSDIRHAEFTSADAAHSGDFVYFDPPYVPVSKTSNFVGYTKGGFGRDAQDALAKLAWHLKQIGVRVLLSNAGTPSVREMYESMGMTVEEVNARRGINCDASKRGDVKEFLIT